MAFSDLDNARPSGGKRLPPSGVMVSVRTSGPEGKRSRYIAVLIGPDAAKALHFHRSPTPVRIQVGNGQDAGKLRIAADPAGKFEVRKQPGGGFLATIRGAAIDGRLRTDFQPFTLPVARIVPGTGNDGPSTIFTIGEATQP